MGRYHRRRRKPCGFKRPLPVLEMLMSHCRPLALNDVLRGAAWPVAALLAMFLSACGGGGGGGAPDPGGIPAAFSKVTLDTRLYPDARCNDGTPAVFYIQAGVGSSASAPASRTVIGLQGGGYCLSDAECRGRSSDLTSSSGYPASIVPEGLLSSTDSNPTFRSWNRVRVPYCSSDFYSGDAGPTGGSTNFQFRGAKIVQAVIATLNSRYGIGKAGDTVLLAGTSAGAVGAFINANRVRSALPGATVLTLIDAGVYPDVAPPRPGTPPRESVRDLGVIGLSYWNGQPDADCIAANPSAPSLCYLFEHAAPTLATPFFVLQNAIDLVGITNVGLLPADADLSDPVLQAWLRDTYLPAMGGILSRVGVTSGQGVFGVCASPQLHTQSSQNAVWAAPVAALGDVSPQAAVAGWVGSGAAATQYLVPACSPG